MKRLIASALVAGPVAAVVLVLSSGEGKTDAPAQRLVLRAPTTAASKPLTPVTPLQTTTPAPTPKTEVPRLLAPNTAPAPADDDEAGHDHSGADDPDSQELLEKAKAVAAKGAEVSLGALRGTDGRFAQAVAEALLDDPMTLVDRKLLEGIVALGEDKSATLDQRLVALDLIGRASGTDVTALERVAAVSLDPTAPADVRAAAVGAIAQLSLDREDLIAPARTALIAYAEKATDAEARADAVDAIRAEGASTTHLEKMATFLSDTDAGVRGAAARALGASDPSADGVVARALERSLGLETDADTACASLASVVRVGGAGTDAILARVEKSPVVRDNPELARQVKDYRAVLAKGETDPIRVLQSHDELEDERSETRGE
jgi:hypothetical protein